MHAPANPFVVTDTKARNIDRVAFGVLRTATYVILACATLIFGVIFVKGSYTVFQSKFPFVNIEFLTQSPETLYVFEYEGQKMELGDRAFRAFKAEKQLGDIPVETYAHSAGGIWPCIVGTFQLVVGSMAIALFIGISSAIFLNEYSSGGRMVNAIRLAILNLAGVPSIVFGLFGLGLFVHFMPVIQTFDSPSAL